MSLVYFLILVGVLVVIHETGHFLAAKLLDFKVLRFSLGFGRPLLRVRRGETDYQIAIFPIGGYVRILGEEIGDTISTHDEPRSFAAKPLWQRLIVVLAGPAANLLLPIAIYFLFFFGHSVLPAAVIGDVLDDGPADRAGLLPGDRILRIGDVPTRYWEDVEQAIHEHAGREVPVRLQRRGDELVRYLRPVEHAVRTDSGLEHQGRIGITQRPFPAIVGVIDPSSPAGQAPLTSGDRIVAVDGRSVQNWFDLVDAVTRTGDRKTLVYLRADGPPSPLGVRRLHAGTADLVPQATATRGHYETGLAPAELLVASVDAGTPADRMGLLPGDLVTAIDGTPLRRWTRLEQTLSKRPGQSFLLEWQRTTTGGVTRHQARFTQVERTTIDEFGNSATQRVFGAHPVVFRTPTPTVAIDHRFRYAAARAVERTTETIRLMTTGLAGIVWGDDSHTVGGPLTMYRAAQVSGEKGWRTFLLMIALVSVNLGLINLLPVPVLDGGHVLVIALETIRRQALAPAARAGIQRAGLLFIAVITVLALRNDIVRYLLQ